MRIHRSAHGRDFTVLPNATLQDRQLSYTARGLLADLLSRPDDWQEDGRRMADSSPQGRAAVRKALKELTEAGYYVVETSRLADGTILSENHVFDLPRHARPPDARPPGPGGPGGDVRGTVPKNPEKEPSLPAAGTEIDAPSAHPAPEGPEGPEEPEGWVAEAVALLFRVIRPEPRLRLGAAEAESLAPLVAQWLERGSSAHDLAHALLPGLPAALHSPVALLRHRLSRKMPPVPAPAAAPARLAECARCHDPVPRPGICRPCAGLGRPRPATRIGGGAAATLLGAARARAALRATRSPEAPAFG
ncbi:hypothetical protein ACIQBJ_13025 [Kitasatospora sp. NPDC088391]|uniref:hypothetical protein n=1 Tax=Kitasatospora sp. NPDC088391 TaxID=3364074 RepID=UPI0037FA03AC